MEKSDILSIVRPYEHVAKATIQTTIPTARVGGTTLGNECYEVVVNSVMKRDALLLRPYGNKKTMGNAFGQSIAWPPKHMMNDEKAAKHSRVLQPVQHREVSLLRRS